MYLLKLAARPWKKTFVSHFLSMMAVGFMSFVLVWVFWFWQALEPVVERIRNQQVMTAYLDSNIPDGQITSILDEVKMTLGSSLSRKDGVGQLREKEMHITYTGIEDFLEKLKGTYPELQHILMDLGTEMSAVVPRYITITGLFPESDVKRLESLNGISNVDSSHSRAAHLVTAFMSVRWIIVFLGIGIAVALTALGLQLSRMFRNLQLDVMSLFRFWGGSALQSRLPTLLSGATSGLVAGIIGFGFWVFVMGTISQHIGALSPFFSEIQFPGTYHGLWVFLLSFSVLMVSTVISSARLNSNETN